MTVRSKSTASRVRVNRMFTLFCMIAASASVIVLGVLLASVALDGFPGLSWGFVVDPPSRAAEEAGLGPALWGTIWICAVCAFTAIPLGVGTAIFLEEYKPRSRWLKHVHGFIQLNIGNLAGVPSIVYGILGLTIFVNMGGFFGGAREPSVQFGVQWYDAVFDAADQYLLIAVDHRESPETEIRYGVEAVAEETGRVLTIRTLDYDAIDAARAEVEAELAARPDATEAEREALRIEALGGIVEPNPYVQRYDKKSWYYLQLPFGRSVLAGGLTLMLVVLPIIIISAQEAIRSVPNSLRHGALGLGATKWQMIRQMTLPAAIPGIMTGSILAMSRAIGEAAPILIITGIVFVRFTPQHTMDEFTAMPLQIYNWASRPKAEFHQIAATGIIVLLAILLTFNATAVFIRQKFQKPLK